MKESLNRKTRSKEFNKIIFILIITLIFQGLTSFAQEKSQGITAPFDGVPKVTIEIGNLDDTGTLIYCGVDLAVFWNPDKDGKFTVVPNDGKIKRLITTHTNITFDLGSVSSYKKGVQHKLAMRTLYVPAGDKQEPIVIADAGNGKDGWVEVPGTLFVPTYFINPPASPYILHTDKWDQNRDTYNTVKAKFRQDSSIRSAGTFWSGEKFVVQVETAEVVSAVAITILNEKNDKNQPYQAVLTDYKNHDTVSEAAIYSGELWEKSMFNKWGNYIPKELQFKMEILGSDGAVLEEKITEVIIDNRDLYYRYRREF